VAASAATERGHDVRDEIFEIARPLGWSVEKEDPPGMYWPGVIGT
jgi:hypothetical protein